MGLRIHDLKVHPEHFRALRDGSKPFEIRRNDRGYEVGDELRLREWVPSAAIYSGEEERRVVTIVSDFAQQEGYVVLGLSRLRAAPEVAEPDAMEWVDAMDEEAVRQREREAEQDYYEKMKHGYAAALLERFAAKLRAALRSPRIEKAERDALIGAMNRIYNRAWLSITDSDERMSLKADGEALSAFVYAALPSPRIEGDER